MLYRTVLCQNIDELLIDLLKYLVLMKRNGDIVFIIAYKIAFDILERFAKRSGLDYDTREMKFNKDRTISQMREMYA